MSERLRASTPAEVEERVDYIWDKIDNGGGGGGGGYVLPVASDTTLGGIKVGENLTIASDGTLSADAESYTLPVASASTLGGVKIGTGINVSSNGTISVDGGATKGMKIRSLTFTGNGTTPNPIEFPTIPYQILSVNTKGADSATPIYVPGFPWGQKTYAGLYSTAGSGGIIYGNFNYGIGSKVIMPSGNDIGYYWNANGAQTEIRYIAAEDLEDNPYESLPFYLPTSDYYYIVQADANIGGRGYSKPNTNPTISFVGTDGSFSTLIHIGLNAADVNNGWATAIATTTTYGGKTWYWTGTGYAMSGSDINGAYPTWPSTLTYDASIGSFSEQDIHNILTTLLGSED